MTRLGKRRRAKKDSITPDAKYHCKSTTPSERNEVKTVNENERQEWQGFCEIESDPVSVSIYDTILNVMYEQELIIFFTFGPSLM